jgi:hypothetical protein
LDWILVGSALRERFKDELKKHNLVTAGLCALENISANPALECKNNGLTVLFLAAGHHHLRAATRALR